MNYTLLLHPLLAVVMESLACIYYKPVERSKSYVDALALLHIIKKRVQKQPQAARWVPRQGMYERQILPWLLIDMETALPLALARCRAPGEHHPIDGPPKGRPQPPNQSSHFCTH